MICLPKCVSGTPDWKFIHRLDNQRTMVASRMQPCSGNFNGLIYDEMGERLWDFTWQMAEIQLGRQATQSIYRFTGPKKEPR